MKVIRSAKRSMKSALRNDCLYARLGSKVMAREYGEGRR